MPQKMADATDQQQAVVLTPIPLTKNQLSEVSQIINKITKSRFNVINRVDKTIIGGMHIRIGDRIIDATLRNKIEKLKEKLLS